MKPRKFNFIAMTQLMKEKKADVPTCSFNLQTGMLSFSASNHTLPEYKGKFVKLFADPAKKAIGWMFLETEKRENMEGYMQIKDVKGTTKLYLPRKLLLPLSLDPKLKYTGLEIKTYTDTALLGDQRPIHFVVLEGKEKLSKQAN